MTISINPKPTIYCNLYENTCMCHVVLIVFYHCQYKTIASALIYSLSVQAIKMVKVLFRMADINI